MTNSLAALKQKDRALSNRERAIYAFLSHREPMTDREIVSAMGFRDMNDVRPRITALIKLGWLVNTGDTVCKVTGCKVRTVKALTAKERAAGMEAPRDLFAE